MQGCVFNQKPIPSELIGHLTESSLKLDNINELQRRLRDDGYIFLRNALDLDDAFSARQEILETLVDVGEIKTPAIEGIFTGSSRRLERPEGLGPFWKAVSEGQGIRQLTHGKQLKQIMTELFGQESRPHDYIFIRVAPVGRATGLHYDYPFFARGSDQIYTVWIALGAISIEEGPLIVVQDSTTFLDLIKSSREIDYDSTSSPKVMVKMDPISLAKERQVKLLTASFQAGDIVVFGMNTLHGSMDNNSTVGQVRLSCDVRFQPASDPLDERYFGSDPKGTTGIGYAELNGAKPLTSSWHQR